MAVGHRYGEAPAPSILVTVTPLPSSVVSSFRHATSNNWLETYDVYMTTHCKRGWGCPHQVTSVQKRRQRLRPRWESATRSEVRGIWVTLARRALPMYAAFVSSDGSSVAIFAGDAALMDRGSASRRRGAHAGRETVASPLGGGTHTHTLLGAPARVSPTTVHGRLRVQRAVTSDDARTQRTASRAHTDRGRHRDT